MCGFLRRAVDQRAVGAWSSKNDERWTNLPKGLLRLDLWRLRMNGSSKGFWAWSSKNDERWTDASKGFWGLIFEGGWTDLQGLLRLDLEERWALASRAVGAWSWSRMCGSSKGFLRLDLRGRMNGCFEGLLRLDLRRTMNACFEGPSGLDLRSRIWTNRTKRAFGLDSSGFAWERLEFQSFKAFV